MSFPPKNPSPASKMLQIVLVTHLHLVTSAPTNRAGPCPGLCAFCWFVGECWWVWPKQLAVCKCPAGCAEVLLAAWLCLPLLAGWSVLVPGQSFSTGLQLPWLNGSGEVKIKFNYLCVLALLLWPVAFCCCYWDGRGFTEKPERNLLIFDHWPWPQNF